MVQTAELYRCGSAKNGIYANGRELQKLAYYNGRPIITVLVFVTRDH